MHIRAQQEVSNQPKSISVVGGYGSFAALDTYLTPYEYTGADYRLMVDVSKLRREEKLLTQHTLNLNYSKLTNLSGRGLYHSAFIDYCYARQYLTYQHTNFRWMMGPSLNSDFGVIYNVRNENNPVQVKAMVNLNYSSVADYRFSIKSVPLLFRYQLRIPVMGVGFAPEYGASYYEMFQLGNTTGIVHFLSFHNQLAMQNLLSLDIPLWGNKLRVGYYNSYYQTRINGLETSITAHNVVVGYSGDFLHLDQRKKR